MKVVKYPPIESWASLCERPAIETSSLDASVREIMDDVRKNGDRALRKYNSRFDKYPNPELAVSEEEIAEALQQIDTELKKSIDLAAENIEKFHKSQLEAQLKTETSPGVSCWRESRPIEKVGLYIPGGSAPLFSSVLMLAIPAAIAGCKEVIICTPPGPDGSVDPAILYSASACGVNKIYKSGGAQAIAAMAYGTETVPSVFKVFGPGNQYVTRAKEMVQPDGIAIDMPAGPSEVLVIADGGANPVFVAADLLSQAEHGADSQVILLSNSEKLIENTVEELKIQLEVLPRKAIAEEALGNSRAVLLNSLEDCMELSNIYAPEHLILAVREYNYLSEKVMSAGSVFLGDYSCESAGDYASGTNHTLPTNGKARSFSGVSVDSFIKKISFQEITATGLRNIGPAIEIMAANEQLDAHRNAVSIRLKSLDNERNQ